MKLQLLVLPLVIFTLSTNVWMTYGITRHLMRYFHLRPSQIRGIKQVIRMGLVADYLKNKGKPTKGILPVPLPIPFPVPIEWEQPPVVIHPQKEVVPVGGSMSDSLTLKRTVEKTTAKPSITSTTKPPDK